MSFPKNPVIGTNWSEKGNAFIFDGVGWVQDNAFLETDPIFLKEKKNFVLKTDFETHKESTSEQILKRQIDAEFKIRKSRKDCIFNQNQILLLKGDDNIINNKDEIIPRFCCVQNSNGIQHFNAIFIYQNDNSVYLTDEKGLLGINSNFEWFEIHYDVIKDRFLKNENYDVFGSLGRNTLDDEGGTAAIWHANMILDVFKSIYPENKNKVNSTFDFPELSNQSLLAKYTPQFCVKNKINLILKPYSDGARDEQISSNPDILTVASHYNNDNLRKDITPSDAEFLSNVIAVSAGQKLADTSIWTSYGFGVEFCETFDKADIDARYPTRGYYKDAAFVKTVPNDNTTITVTDPKYNNIAVLIDMRVGDKVYIDLTSGTVEATILNIVDPQTFKLDKDLGVVASALLNYNCTIGGSNKYQPEQSPTCAIVGAKFRIIQDRTNANWQLIREACRMTASNSTMTVVDGKKVYTPHWDMYRGFGIIDVDKAVEYIRENYSENTEYKESVVATMPKVNSLIGYKDLQAENYVPKSVITNLMKLMFAGRNLAPKSKLLRINGGYTDGVNLTVPLKQGSTYIHHNLENVEVRFYPQLENEQKWDDGTTIQSNMPFIADKQYKSFRIYSNLSAINNVKLEEGSKTPYTPAPEDLGFNVSDDMLKYYIPNFTNGYTFTPSLASDGTLSWTNNGSLPNPSSVNIKGPQGPIGLQGNPGSEGTGILSVGLEYVLSTSKTVQPVSGWSAIKPERTPDNYVWTRTKIDYKNPSSTEYIGYSVDTEWENYEITPFKLFSTAIGFNDIDNPLITNAVVDMESRTQDLILYLPTVNINGKKFIIFHNTPSTMTNGKKLYIDTNSSTIKFINESAETRIEVNPFQTIEVCGIKSGVNSFSWIILNKHQGIPAI